MITKSLNFVFPKTIGRSIKLLSYIIFLSIVFLSYSQTLAKENKLEKSKEVPTLKQKITYYDVPDEKIGPLTFEETINFALKYSPLVYEFKEKVLAAKGEISLAKTAYLPTGGLLYQTNRATRNNITGLLFPQNVIPNISGPVVQKPNFGSAWGTATGGLISWEILDFGLKKAKVNLAKSGSDKATLESELTEFEVISKVSDAFFTLIASEETVKAIEANVKRNEVFVDSTKAIVKSGLRPGVDTSRAEAELAASHTQLAKAKENREIARAYLAELLGVAGKTITIKQERFLNLPTETKLPDFTPDLHPQVEVQKSNLSLVQAKKKILFHSYFPKLDLQGALYGRGSGADHTGDLRGGANGLFPTRLNFAGGITANLPIFDYPSIRIKQKIEKSNEEVEKAKYVKTIQEIIGKYSQAKIIYEFAQEIAKEVKIQEEAARMTETQAKARYKAGLGTVVEVADGEELLTKAEIENALAKLGLWKALLDISISQGDIKPFLSLAKQNNVGSN